MNLLFDLVRYAGWQFWAPVLGLVLLPWLLQAIFKKRVGIWTGWVVLSVLMLMFGFLLMASLGAFENPPCTTFNDPLACEGRGWLMIGTLALATINLLFFVSTLALSLVVRRNSPAGKAA